MVLADVVERAEALVQVLHQLLGGHLLAQGREALEIGEEHGDVIDLHGVRLALRLQLFGHFFRQDVQQEFLRAVLLHLQYGFCASRIPQSAP